MLQLYMAAASAELILKSSVHLIYTRNSILSASVSAYLLDNLFLLLFSAELEVFYLLVRTG